MLTSRWMGTAEGVHCKIPRLCKTTRMGILKTQGQQSSHCKDIQEMEPQFMETAI